MWIALLCICSERQTGELDIDPAWFAHHAHVSEAALGTAIEKLSRNGCVTCATRTRTQATRTRTATNGTGRDERDGTNETGRDGTAAPPPLHPLAELWNEISEGQPSPLVRAMGKKRQAAAEARWREHPNPEYWRTVIKRAVLASHFCRGQNDRGWVADFEFLVKPDTHLKIMEGKYDNRDRAGPPRRMTNAEVMSQANKELYDKVERGEA